MTASGASPCPSHPLRRAPPMRPAPTNNVVRPECLCLPGPLKHGSRPRLLGRLPAPENELEGWVIMLAGFDGEVEQRLALRRAGAGVRKDHRVAEDQCAFLGEKVEMSDPELGVDVRQERGHLHP